MAEASSHRTQHRDVKITLAESGLSIAYQEWGDQAGFPVICLHGWQDNCASFATLAPLLPSLRVIAIDLPGHGHSSWLGAGAHYHFVDWVVPLRFLMDELKIPQAAVIGHSMGAGIGMLFAACFPESVAYLCMIEAFAPMPHRTDEIVTRVVKHYQHRRKHLGKEPRSYPDLDAATKVRMAAHLPSYHAAALITARGTSQTERGLVWRNDPRLKSGSTLGFTLGHIRHCLQQVQCPSDIFLGEQGAAVIAEAAVAYADDLGRFPIHRIPGSHHCHMESPDAVASRVMAQLNRLSPGSHPPQPCP